MHKKINKNRNFLLEANTVEGMFPCKWRAAAGIQSDRINTVIVGQEALVATQTVQFAIAQTFGN